MKDCGNGVGVLSASCNGIWGYHIRFELLDDSTKGMALLPITDKMYCVHFFKSRKPYTDDEIERLVSCVSEYLKPGDMVTSRGGCTPGGLHGVKRFVGHGFVKTGEYYGDRLYWSEPEVDMDKFSKWVAKAENNGDFRAVCECTEYTLDSVQPVIWEVRKL